MDEVNWRYGRIWSGRNEEERHLGNTLESEAFNTAPKSAIWAKNDENTGKYVRGMDGPGSNNGPIGVDIISEAS